MKNMANINSFLRSVAPDGVDFGYSALLAGVLMLLGNLATLLDSFNVPGSRQLLQSELGQSITSFLEKIDDFSFTKTGVLFLFWCFVGLVVYYVVQTLMTANSEVQYEREVASSQYVHPTGFDRSAYRRQVVRSHFAKFGLSVLFGVSIVVLFALILPFADSKLASLITQPSVSFGLMSLLGFCLVALGIAGSLMAFRASRRYRSLVS